MSKRTDHNKKKKEQALKVSIPIKTIPQQNGLRNLLWLGAILFLTFIVFLPSLDNAFTNWDDPRYLNDNPLIRNLSVQNIKRIFSEVYFGNYQPLHIFSYALEYHFYQLNPFGYHLTSLIMHLITTGLVFRFIFLISENSAIALITALLFGIHPLHVESVVWAAERKDLLYAIFFIGSLNYYIRYIKSGQKIKYLLFAFLLFTLSLFSKTMAVSLAPVLILIDFYYGRKFNVKMVLEKIPFFSLAVLLGFISASTARETGQVSLNVFTLLERIMFANLNLLTYLWKLILPVHLSAFYPYPDKIDGHIPYYCYIAPFVVIGLMLLIFLSLRKTKVILFGAGFFVASVFLVLQLFPVGGSIISERYSYISSIGFFFVVAYFFQQLILHRPYMKITAYAALVFYSLFLCASTYARCDVWKDSLTLWNNVLEQFPNVGIALNNRGNIYGKEMGDLDMAMFDYNRSVQFNPGYKDAYVNRGIVYCMKGKFDLAITDFNQAIKIEPDYFEAIYNRGIAFIETKEFDKAITDLNKIELTHADDARIFFSRGRAFSFSGKNDEALADFNHAISLNPGYAEVFYYRSFTLYSKHQFKAAYADLLKATNLGIHVEKDYYETIKKAAENNSK